MLAVAVARQRILNSVPLLPAETVPLALAEKRSLASDIRAAISLPPFDNSAMDGYAVRAADVAGASLESPITLRQVGRIPAGSADDFETVGGTCVRVFTGSPMPRGADAVVMQENCRAKASDQIDALDSVKPWENVRFAGEDVRAGSVVVAAGERLTIGHVSLLSALGIADVSCRLQPRVGVIATGDELREPGDALGRGQIFENNRIALRLLAQRAGAITTVYPIVRDTLADTEAALRRAFSENDVVVSAGGVSVGEMDFVKTAFSAVGGRLEFWRIAMKPGKPFVFGEHAGKLFFGLPGNPLSALVGFTLLVEPALVAMQGQKNAEPRSRPGVMAEPLENRGDRPHFMRVKTDTSGGVRSAGIQASHILSALPAADGLVEVPPNTTLEAGAVVQVLDWL